jgi:hypothetical protein
MGQSQHHTHLCLKLLKLLTCLQAQRCRRLLPGQWQ